MADREEPDRPIRPIRVPDEDHRHPPSTFGEGCRRSDSSHREPYDSRRPSFSSDGESPPHPEVHRVRGDSPVMSLPILIVSTSTRPTTVATPFDLGTADDNRENVVAMNDVADRLTLLSKR